MFLSLKEMLSHGTICIASATHLNQLFKTYYSQKLFTMNSYLNEHYYECIMWDLSMYPFQGCLFNLTC